jgi:DNA-directed RNA polymerase alpha subunit
MELFNESRVVYFDPTRVQRGIPMSMDTKASLLTPMPELPDDTLIDRLEFPSRIRRVLQAQGLATVGQVRETSDEVLMSIPGFGPTSIKYLRDTLGLPSEEGVRCGRPKVDIPA